jgi:hypothetical protein
MSRTCKKRVLGPPRTGTTVAASVVLGVGLVLFLCFALVVVIGRANNIVSASGGGTTGSVGTVKGGCGNPGQPSCPIDPGWFPGASESPAVITAALAQSRDVVMMREQYGYAQFDMPILVHHYGSRTGVASNVATLPPTFVSGRDGVLPVLLFGASDEQTFDLYTTHDGGATWNGTAPLQTRVYTAGGVGATATTMKFVDMNTG